MSKTRRRDRPPVNVPVSIDPAEVAPVISFEIGLAIINNPGAPPGIQVQVPYVDNGVQRAYPLRIWALEIMALFRSSLKKIVGRTSGKNSVVVSVAKFDPGRCFSTLLQLRELVIAAYRTGNYASIAEYHSLGTLAETYKQKDKEKEFFAAYLMGVDILLIYLALGFDFAHRYEPGRVTGLAVEFRVLMRAHLPESGWRREAREIVRTAFAAGRLEETLTQIVFPPSPDDDEERERVQTGDEGRVWSPRPDPARLAFYIFQEDYVEPRAAGIVVPGEIAVVRLAGEAVHRAYMLFRKKGSDPRSGQYVMVADTEETGHTALFFKGTLQDLMAFVRLEDPESGGGIYAALWRKLFRGRKHHIGEYQPRFAARIKELLDSED